MRTTLALLVLAATAALGGCATPAPVRMFGLNRDTPAAAYEWFKAAAAANQWAAEWSMFSPNARKQADQLAGRHVDLGDYSTARQTLATNGTADMQALLQSRIEGIQMLSETSAVVTMVGGGRRASVRMVRLTTWELRVKGEAEPYADFLRSAGDAVSTNADGSITVRITPAGNTGSYLRTIPRDRIDGFAVQSLWYVDDLSGLQGAVSGIGAEPPRAPAAPSTPAAPPPAAGDLGSPG
jgi:hypothetical protein